MERVKMIQLGLRLHDSVDLPIEERLQEVKKQGFTCAHIALSKLQGQSADPMALTPGYATYLKNVFKDAGIDIAVLGCYLNLANPDQNMLKETQDKYMAHLRFASLLGCSVVGTETGAPNTTYTYDKEACHSDEALGIFIRNLKPVVNYAEKMGVIMAIEPVYKHIVWNPKRARAVLDAIDSPNLQIILDPVNLLHYENYNEREEVFQEAIDLLGKDVAVIHLKDGVLNGEEVKSMGCGLGEIDLSTVIKFAVEKKPYIQATLEDTKPENAESCRLHIAEIEKKFM
jgi:sugar phosphate isomerase/epimerase